jgi:hypothetical protein
MKKVTLSLGVLLLLRLSSAQQTEWVVLTVVGTGGGTNGDGARVTVENASVSPLTALSVGAAETGSGASAVERFDSAIQRWTRLPPGHGSEIFLTSVRGSDRIPRLAAAIFANGDVDGEPMEIQQILDERKSVLKGLEIVLEHMPVASTANLTREEAVERFREARRDQLAAVGDGKLKAAVINVNLWIGRELMKLPAPLDQSLDKTGYLATMTDKLIRWHADLSASKPSLVSQ